MASIGTPPPPDAPSPPAQGELAVAAGFEISPPIELICGYKIPGFKFGLSLKIPFKLPPFPPTFFLSIGLNCNLDNPIDVSAGIGYGGGRVSTTDPDPDENAKF